MEEVQKPVAKTNSENNNLKKIIYTLREKVENGQIKTQDLVQNAKSLSTLELNSLRKTISSLREELENANRETGRRQKPWLRKLMK